MPKTNNYEQFKFRTDNRVSINQKHIRDLMESIKSRNLLELRPITVNGDMEVLDGQHRLLAAKALGVEIFYQIEEKLTSGDIIIMNVSKQWGMLDYLNYYTKNGFLEYQRLEAFIKEHNISLKVAQNLTIGTGKDKKAEFRLGTFVFPEGDFTTAIDVCWETIGVIKKQNGFSGFTSNARFWQCLVMLANHPDFDHKKWMFNLERLATKLGPRSSNKDYLRMLMDVYNYKNHSKIDLLSELKIEEVA